MARVLRLAATVAALTTLVIGASPNAQASLLNDSVTCGGGDFDCFPSTATVTAGVEFPSIKRGPNFNLFSGDVGAADITLLALTNSTIVDPLVLTFGDLDDSSGGVITGVSLTTNTHVTGLTLSDISHGDHSVSIALGGTSWTALVGVDPGEAVITLSFAPTTAAPLPPTLELELLGFAVAGIGVACARKGRARPRAAARDRRAAH